MIVSAEKDSPFTRLVLISMSTQRTLSPSSTSASRFGEDQVVLVELDVERAQRVADGERRRR